MERKRDWVFVGLMKEIYDCDIYIDKNNKLYSVYMNQVFDEDIWRGPYSSMRIRKMVHVKPIDEYVSGILRRQNTTPELMVHEEHILDHVLDFIDSLPSRLADTIENGLEIQGYSISFLEDIRYGDITLVLYEGETKALTLFHEFISESDMNFTEKTYLRLSGIGIAPEIILHTRDDFSDIEYFFVITDYISMSLQGILEYMNNFQKNKILREALKISYTIRGMEYYGQKLGDGFLYDENTDRLYFADFTGFVENNYTKPPHPELYIRELSRSVTEEEILDGVY